MWDDPLFNPGDAEDFLGMAKDEPDWAIKKRRELVLHALDCLFERMDEECARFMWLWRRVEQYLPLEVHIELATVLRDAKTIDPEFTFRKELERLDTKATR